MALATTSIYNIFSLHNSLIQSNLVGVKFNDIVPNWYRRTPRRNTMESRNAFKKVWFNHKIPVFIRIQLMTIHFILWRILENFKMIGQRKYVTQIIIHHLFASVNTEWVLSDAKTIASNVKSIWLKGWANFPHFCCLKWFYRKQWMWISAPSLCYYFWLRSKM